MLENIIVAIISITATCIGFIIKSKIDDKKLLAEKKYQEILRNQERELEWKIRRIDLLLKVIYDTEIPISTRYIAYKEYISYGENGMAKDYAYKNIIPHIDPKDL